MFSTLARHLAGLRARYAEPHRVYHGQAHIDAMLDGWRGLGDAVAHSAAFEVAIWYHDAVYDPARPDNEARSADLMRAELGDLADPDLVERADRMIRLTAGHHLSPDVPAGWRGDTALFLDLDLAVLGASAAAYDAYEAGIAAEYGPVHGPAYRPGRAGFLEALLARPRLYHSERFHARLDAPARANLRRALAGLRSRPTASRGA